MKLPEFRKQVKALSDEKKDRLIEEIYRRADKQNKAMIEILLECIKADQELPPLKAVVPDLKAVEKDLKTIQDHLEIGYYFIRRSTRKRLKQKSKAAYQQMIKAPIQDPDYDLVVEKMDTLFRYVCEMDRLFYPSSNEFFTNLRTTRAGFFRTVCTMTLAKGYTIEKLGSLLTTIFKAQIMVWGQWFVEMKVLESFLKNGDIRLDMLDFCQEKIQKAYAQRKADSEGTDDPYYLRQICLYAMFLYILESYESSPDDAKKQIEDVLEPNDAKLFLNEILPQAEDYYEEAVQWETI